jgi:membrane protease YdiL (CAAX protease family)
MLISAIVDPRPKQGSGRQRWIAFGGFWLISWIIMTLYYWQVEKLKLVVAVILWAIIATLPAWVLSSAFAKTPGIRKHFTTLLKPRGEIVWYLVAFFTVPALAMLGAGITRLLGGVEVHFRLEGMSLGQSLIFLSLTFLSGFLCTGGINEESGWRGFAMPRLQARFPVIVSITIVWFFWSLWHIPYDLGLGVDPKWMLLNRTLIMFTFSVLFAWVYNRTKGSILAPAIFHPSMNAFGNNLPFTTASVILYVALAVFAILYDRMWKKLPMDDPAVYQDADPEVHAVVAAAPFPTRP